MCVFVFLLCKYISNNEKTELSPFYGTNVVDQMFFRTGYERPVNVVDVTHYFFVVCVVLVVGGVVCFCVSRFC